MLVLDAIDKELLNHLQTEIPLMERPFAVLGKRLGVHESEVVERLQRMKHPEKPERPIVRQISAIFDSKSLGYETTLVAAKIPEERLDAGAAAINGHPGVSHNYRRNHAFNLWYTLAVPPDSKLGLKKTLEILHGASGAESTRMLPTVRLFKIGVKFDLSGESDLTERAAQGAGVEDVRAASAPMPMTEGDKGLIRVLQQDLPIVSEPFAVWAEEAGMTVGELLSAARGYLDRKVMRRFAAVLKHREAGISANAMGAWAVPAEGVEAFGALAASFKAVSHCYLRTTYADWPYSIFTMVHAPTKEQCEGVLAEISRASGVAEYAALYSSTEYKKVRVKYFTPENAAWEARAMGGSAG